MLTKGFLNKIYQYYFFYSLPELLKIWRGWGGGGGSMSPQTAHPERGGSELHVPQIWRGVCVSGPNIPRIWRGGGSESHIPQIWRGRVNEPIHRKSVKGDGVREVHIISGVRTRVTKRKPRW